MTSLKKLARIKYSSLYYRSVSDKEKKSFFVTPEPDEAAQRRREQSDGDAGKDQEEARLPPEEQEDAPRRQDHPEQESIHRHLALLGHDRLEEVRQIETSAWGLCYKTFYF